MEGILYDSHHNCYGMCRVMTSSCHEQADLVLSMMMTDDQIDKWSSDVSDLTAEENELVFSWSARQCVPEVLDLLIDGYGSSIVSGMIFGIAECLQVWGDDDGVRLLLEVLEQSTCSRSILLFFKHHIS